MIRVCYRCRRIFGEKEPFEDKSETHGVCEECWPAEVAYIREQQGIYYARLGQERPGFRLAPE